MKEYKCYFYNNTKNEIVPDSIKQINASTHEKAYENYIAEVNDILIYRVCVESIDLFLGETKSFFSHMTNVDNNIEFDVVEAKKRIEEQKVETGEHPQESADKENSNFDHPKIDAKLEDISATSTTEKLLLNIALTQEKQFQELKKLNYKLWSFWIFFIGLPILAWILTQ